MEIVAKLVQVLPVQNGESKAGTPWKKQEFILETDGQYPKKMCMSMMGADKIAAIENLLKEGTMLKVSFDAESREFNGKWYTNLNAWRIDLAGAVDNNNTSRPVTESAGAVHNAPTITPSEVATSTDDLPF